jgi:hypothetical protein
MLDLEPGMVFKGAFGQVRELVSKSGIKCTYRLLAVGLSDAHQKREIGREYGPISIETFAAWAEADITETWRAA